MTKENHRLGEFTITGLPRLNAGKAKVTVFLEIDSNGMLNLTAVDKSDDNN